MSYTDTNVCVRVSCDITFNSVPCTCLKSQRKYNLNTIKYFKLICTKKLEEKQAPGGCIIGILLIALLQYSYILHVNKVSYCRVGLCCKDAHQGVQKGVICQPSI